MVLVLVCTMITLLAVTSPALAATFSNPAGLTVSLPPCDGLKGVANIYPSNIAVSGLSGTVSDVNVALHGMNLFGGDFEILLVGPGAARRTLCSSQIVEP